MYKVSVIIPIYNAEKYLPACLDSAVNQTLKEIEIICIDDGSPDNCARIVAEFAEKHPNIKLIRQENSGPSIARNAGLDIAAGEYICFLDSDDSIDNRALEYLHAKAAQEQLDVLYFNARVVYENGQIRQQYAEKDAYYARTGNYAGICTGQTMFAKMRKDGNFLPSTCLQLFRRAFLEENGIRFYPGILHEDNLFSFRSAMTAQRVNYVPDELYFRRLRPGSIMTSPKTMPHVDGHLVCFRECVNFLKDITVQEDAAFHVDTFLYNRLLQEAAIIWQQLPEEEQKKPPCNGDHGAKQLLDAALRICKLENRTGTLTKQKQTLTERNHQLAGQLQAARRKLRKLEEEKSRRPAERIRRFFRSVRRRGLAYYIRAAFWKTGTIFARFMSARTRGAAWAYFTLAADKGFRFARQELPKLRRDGQLRRQMKKGALMPLVSVIVPVYNGEKFLEKCLESLLFQTLARIEIICVDDGSTDGSLRLLRRYEKIDCRVRVFTQKNQFAGIARNLGLSKARGEYVLFLDADDFFEKTLVEDACLAAKRDDADVVLYGARLYNNVTKTTIEAPWLLDKRYLPAARPFNRNDCPDTLLQTTTPCSWTKLFRRQFLLDTGLQFPPLRNAEDAFYIFSALAMAERITTLDKALVYYRTNVKTSLEATKSTVPLCFYEGYKALLDKLKELGLLEQLRRSYVNATLAGCLHSLKTQNDPKVKQTVKDALSAYVFRDLELTGYEPSYYYQDNLYRQMQAILGAVEEKPSQIHVREDAL